jgi:hypothetical protein
VKLILATHTLGIGGSESYLVTVAEQLDRLGHEVTIYTTEPGRGARPARERALELIEDPGSLPDGDAALVQDGAVSYELASLRPDMPQLFVAHSESFAPQHPPQLEGVVGVAVALNDRLAERLRSLATETEVVRLRQPIDTERFLPRGPLPKRARRALLLSNNHSSDRLAMLEEACGDTGLELVRVGGTAGLSTDPREVLAAADIVIGYGRSILEAMACGRAAYVYDWHGGSGWVTADSYAAIEADGAAGRDETVLGPARLREDLRRYEASMGPVNHDIVIAHHRANVHAQQLVELFRRLSPPPARPRTELQEMARLVRLEWRARSDTNGLRIELDRVARELRESHQARLDGAREAEERAQSYESSASWRLTRPLRAVGHLLRGRPE